MADSDMSTTLPEVVEENQKDEVEEEGELEEESQKVTKKVNETRSGGIERKISETSDKTEQRLHSSSVTSQLEVKKTQTSKRHQRLKFDDELDGEGRENYSDDSDSNEPEPLHEEDENEDENEEGQDEEDGEIEKSTDLDEGDNNNNDQEEEVEEDYEEVDEIQTAEEAEALYQKKLDLIDRYLMAKKDYKYLLKKNAYLQDKLYKICVRKGFIVENKGEEEDEKRKKKNGKRKFSIKPNSDAEEMPDGLDDEDEEAWEVAMAEHNETNRGPVRNGELKNFFEAALENKYTKLVRKIWGAEQSKLKNADTHDMNLSKIREKSEKWEKIHEEKFLYLMDRVREASDICLDSNTGQHLSRWETEQYVEEVSKIHAKFCKTLCKMYSNRHGLEFALKRLQETEVQGEGLQMLEYEQLQAENYSLKEKLEDRLKDVENIKAKIAHAVQILAHFRECLLKLQEKMDDGNSKLALINKRVYQVREITDVVTQRYEVFKEEQKNLVSESGLLDNTKLLRDFEKTHYDVMDLKEEKRKLQKQLATKMREVQEILSKIKDVQMNLPELQRLQEKDEATNQPLKKSKIMSSSTQKQKRASQKQDETELNQKRMDRLQFLLEHRNLDPKPRQLKPRKFPRIVEPYKCHFQQF